VQGGAAVLSTSIDWETGCQQTADSRSVVNGCEVWNQVCILRESTDAGLSSELLPSMGGGFNELIERR